MKTLTAHQKILAILKQLQLSNEKLSSNQLINILEHVKVISNDKTTMEIILASVKSLIKRNLPDSKKLTERESEIVLLISNGLQNTDIARNLNLSKSTIETHRKNIRKKLKLKGNDSLFAFALVFSLQSNYHQIIGG